ncbi:MAG TPA: sulfatase [Candidatus Binatia bacterium]|nr:sulfatase [Candidatus Binatia bacterium]
MKRRFPARLALLALVALAAAGCRREPDLRLPDRMRIAEVVADLGGTFDRSAVASERADAPVRFGGIEPSTRYRDVAGAYRPAVLAPAPAVVRYRLDAPAGAVLHFGVGVARDRTAGRHAAGIRFAVRVDGRERWARVVNPASQRAQRRWWDERVDLGVTAPRAVDVELVTALDGSGPPAGTPGWSRLALVREHERARQAATAAAPNVLVLLVDTLRADRLGCYGAQPSPSPTVDRLAAGALVFDQAIAQAPWTMPSVASILTGLPPASHGVVGAFSADDVMQNDEGRASFLPWAIETLPERAEEAGITTVGVTSNALVSRATNYSQGFETWLEFGMDPNFAEGERNWATARDVNDTFVRWLRANGRHRFFAYLHYMDVHDPYTPPPALRPPPPPGIRPQLAQGDLTGIAREVNIGKAPPLSPPEVAYLRALYDAEIAYWDGELARLLAALADAGVADRTIVVVTADHGEEFQEHGRLRHRIHLYEESIHVPLLVHGPGIAPGRVDRLAQGVDLFPTIAALLGLPAPRGLPGENLLAPGDGARSVVAETRFGRTRDGRQTPLVALRTRRWKLIEAPALGLHELYDLAADPSERTDVWARARESAELDATLARIAAAAPPPPASAGRDPDVARKLRALGYVE